MHAIDDIESIDALCIARCFVAGHEWGANAPQTLAVCRPERFERLALLATLPRLGGMSTPPFEKTQGQWYHRFIATRRGAEAVCNDPYGFAHIHWANWSPPGCFSEETFEQVAKAFDNPDWFDVTLYSYRARMDEAESDPRSS